MSEVFAWCSFLGAWLLVAGPLYQGSTELDEMDFDREGIEGIKALAAQAAQSKPSPWWWLFPPAMYVLHRRWTRNFRQATLAQLTDTQREQLASYRNKATGWFTVAAGATLLAAGETWQVVDRHRWPTWLFWLLFVVMLTLAVLNTAIRMIDADRTRPAAEDEAAPVADRG